MTGRKPRGVSFEGWVERQVREARERGAFDDLPGSGKPLPRGDGDELAWVREKLRREDLPVSAVLPASLALAKEVEDLPEVLARQRSEAKARALLVDLNARIDAARRGPQLGPPMRTRPVDVEALITQWQDQRAAAVPASAAATPTPPTRRPRRWWRR